MRHELASVNGAPFGRGYNAVGGPIVGVGISLVPLLLLVLICFAVLRALKGNGLKGREQRRTDAEESRMIQEIHRGLAGLEKRVESLETILLDLHRRTDSGVPKRWS